MYRLWADADSVTHLEPVSLDQMSFENGPGDFKGVGGTVLGAASRLMLMRFEPGVRPRLHRANPGLAVLLQGRLLVAASDGAEIELRPGDCVRIESTGAGGRGGWAPANHGPGLALLAITQMPPPGAATPAPSEER